MPPTIMQPDYAVDGTSRQIRLGIPHSEVLYEKHKKGIYVNTEADVEGIRKACRLAQVILDEAVKLVKVGQTTDEIDRRVHELTVAHDAYPSPLNYYGFPKSLCR